MHKKGLGGPGEGSIGVDIKETWLQTIKYERDKIQIKLNEHNIKLNKHNAVIEYLENNPDLDPVISDIIKIMKLV